MKALRSPLALLVLFLVAGSLVTRGQTEAAGVRCKDIHASLMSKVVEAGTAACPIACTEGRVTGDGLLRGTTRFTATGLTPGAGLAGEPLATTFSDAGIWVDTTDHGALTTSSIGMLDLAKGVFFDIGRVTGGTGRFEGATGTLFFFGNAIVAGPTLFDLSFEGDIRGEVCVVVP